MKKRRLPWDKYFMKFAKKVAERSTCIRRKVGAVLVREKRILATGYNGAPANLPHCEEVGCLRRKLDIPSGTHHELCRGLHGEQNALIQAAHFGVSTKNAILYCTNQPCVICTKMLINAKIKKIYISESYPDELSLKMLDEAEIEMKVKDIDKERG